MWSKVISRICLILAGGVILSGAALAGSVEADWRDKIDKGRRVARAGDADRAAVLFEEAFRLGPTEDHKADALIQKAEAYENALRRADAIATYERITRECPDTRLLAKVYSRLGELHRSISLVRPNASEEEKKAVMNEMKNAISMPYFEKALKYGRWFDRYVLKAKGYLSGIYWEVGRKEDAQKIRDEFISMDIYDVKEPCFVGPYNKLVESRETYAVRVDKARALVNSYRHRAMSRIVETSVRPGNPLWSLARLQQVVEKYHGTDIEKMAKKKIEEMSKEYLKNVQDGVEVLDNPEDDEPELLPEEP